ncbi:MAG: hypothetical protein ACOYXC_09985, partial [Candidatus Rifleibacteriota bacterium]
MKLRALFAVTGILMLSLFCGISGVFAQAPSLAANDQYVVSIETENGEEAFTLIRDGRIGEQFYYVPIKPTIAVEKKDGKPSPVFQLLSYQTKEGDGGILQMSMVTGISKEAVEKLKSKLFSLKLPPGKAPRLSPLPIKSAELTLYDLGGQMLDQAAPKSGIAPIFGTQHYPFMLRLKSLGTDIMKALTTKQGGLPVLITYTFQGMTPKAGFEVEVNWDACYEHFSTNTEVAAEVAKNAVSGGLGLDIATLRESFVSEGLIKINQLTSEEVDAKLLDDLMVPVLDLITKELFEQIHPPTSIPPAEAEKLKEDEQSSEIGSAIKTASEAAMKMAGRFFKVGVKVDFALKDVKIVKKGKFTYKFDRQAIVERTTSYGGLLGIGQYSKDIQDKCFSTMPAGNWERAFYVLPAVGDPVSLGIDNLNIVVRLEENLGNNKWEQVSGYPQQAADFNKNKKAYWANAKGEEVFEFEFAIKALFDKEGFKRENYRFNIITTIKPLSPAKSMQISNTAPLFDGDLAIAPPTDLVDVLTIDASCLTYGEDAGQVFKAPGVLKAGTYSWQFVLDGNNMIKNFMVPTEEKVITVA